MKKIIAFLILVLAGIFTLNAQVMQTAVSGTVPEQTVKYPFSIYKKIHDPAIQDHLISVFVKGDVESIAREVKDLGGVFKYAAGDIAVVRIPVNRINVLAEKRFVERIEGSDAKLEVLNDQMILHNNIYLVQQGVNQAQAYNGEGVVVGIIDEGIDFNHKDLRDEQGHTRIRWLWDQRLGLSGTYTPQPYGYGQNFTNTQIDNLLAGAVVDHDFSHGTAVAGVAAGNGLAVNNYKGVAPKADIIFVAVQTNTSDDNFLTTMFDAVQYIFNKADSLGKPCSINISLGTYFGSHDAKDFQAQAIDNLIAGKNGRFVTCAAGNAGSAPIHLHTDVTPDSSFTWLGGYTTTKQLYFQLWSDTADFVNVQYMVGADKTTPQFEYRGGTTFKSAIARMGYRIDTVFNGSNRIGRVETYLDYSHGSYSFECQITPDTANYRWRFMTKGAGKFDAWSFDFVPAGLPDSTSFPVITKYKIPDTNQNIVSSFTCSPKVMTVGSYVNRNRYTDINLNQVYDSNLVVGSLSDFSSHGPTRDGRIKPEICATGEWMLSSAAQYDLQGTIQVAPSYVGAGGQQRRASGTSFASPVVAGIAALYLQKNPNAAYQEVKDAITACTKTDQFTGASLPNNYWGYGKVDAYKVMNGCTNVGIRGADAYPNVYFENYPNPFSEQTTIHYDFTYSDMQGSHALITISDALGRKVRDIKITGLEGNVVVSKNDIGSGVYFYSLVVDGKIIRTNKLVVL